MRYRARRFAAADALLLAALLGLLAAVALAAGSAQAEATSKTVTLTLTGMVDSDCQLGTGGTTAYIAPGGTVTLKPSLAGASVTVNLLVGTTTVPLDSSHVSSFTFKVAVRGTTHTLTTSSDTLPVTNIRQTTKLSWQATGVTLLNGLGTVPLNGNDVHLPAGGQLDWSGQLVPKSHSKCDIAVAAPTVKASVSSATVTVSGTAVTAPNPIPPVTSKVSSVVSKVIAPIRSRTSSPAGSTPTSGSPGGGTSAPAGHTSAGAPGGTTAGSGTGERAHARVGSGVGPATSASGSRVVAGAPAAAGAAGGSSSGGSAGRSPAVVSLPDASPAARHHSGLSQRSELGPKQLPALLAIAAIIALSLVTSVYARATLLHR